MTDEDFRATALALGYTLEHLTDDMFTGNQREAFLQKVAERASDDTYCAGAYFMLSISSYSTVLCRQTLRTYQNESPSTIP